jgi:hypothetical protein
MCPAARSLAPLLASIVVLAAFCSHARADASADAKAAFAAGQDAERRGAWAEAADAYQRAYDLQPHPNAAYNVGYAAERAGQRRRAATAYDRYLADAPDASDRGRVLDAIAALRAAVGTLEVRGLLAGAPTGAEVILDGTTRGTTPLTLEVPGGAYALELRLGSRSARRNVLTAFGEPTVVELDVSAEPGMLAVRANVAGAEVTIDGFPAGGAPLSTALTGGEHTVEVSAGGYHVDRQTVVIRPGGSASLAFALTAATAPGSAPPPPVPAPQASVLGIRVGWAPAGDDRSVVGLLARRRGRLTGALALGAVNGAFYNGLHADAYLRRGLLSPVIGAGGGYVYGEAAGLMAYLDIGLALVDMLPTRGLRVDARVAATFTIQRSETTAVTVPITATLAFSAR